MKNKKLRVYWVSISLVLAFFIIFLSSVVISRNINYKKYEDVEILKYKLTNNIDYNLDVEKSDYYNNIIKNDNVISSIIKKINLKFNYLLDAGDNINTKTKYSISSKLVVDYLKDISRTNLLTDEKDIISKEISNNTGTIKIEENLVNDYKYYYNYVQKYKGLYPLSGLDAKIIYTFKVDTTGSYKSVDLDDNSESTITISLLNPITSITTNGDVNLAKSLTVQNKLAFIKSPVVLMLGIIIFIIGIIFLIPLFMAIGLVNKDNEFKRNIKNYLKIYDDMIVEANEAVDIEDKEIIEVKSFYELLDAEQELHIPIVFFETVTNKEAWFTITSDNQVWRFILKNKNIS